MRAKLIALVGLTLLAGSLGAAATVTGPVLAQDTDDAAEPVLIAAQEFSLGQRFSGPGWELEVQDAFSVPSPDRADYMEVRVGVAMTTTSTALPYLFNGLTGENGYPELSVRDSSGEHRAIPVTDPGAHLLPGSALSLMLPGVPARWTVGFEVPTAFASTLLLDAAWDGQLVATWDLRSSRAPLGGWTPIPGAAVTDLGETITWGEDLEVVALDHTLLTCGSPEFGLSNVVYGLEVAVTNHGTSDALFPDVRYPDPTGFAIWTDGGSARFSDESNVFVGEEDPGDPLEARNQEQIRIPPERTYNRILTFILPRDSRFVDVEAVPSAVVLVPPGSTPVWLDLGGVPASDTLAFTGCGIVAGQVPFDIDATGRVEQPATVVTTPDGGNL